MASYLRELKALLTAAGCYFVRQGRGDHEVWFSPIVERHVIIDAGTKSRHTANETLKQAGLPKHFDRSCRIHVPFSNPALSCSL